MCTTHHLCAPHHRHRVYGRTAARHSTAQHGTAWHGAARHSGCRDARIDRNDYFCQFQYRLGTTLTRNARNVNFWHFRHFRKDGER